MSPELHPVHPGEGHTYFTIQGTIPESQDGQRLCYVCIPTLDEVWKKSPNSKAELWICKTDLGGRRMLRDDRVIYVHTRRTSGTTITAFESSWKCCLTP
jgi:hypothetical protein